MALSDIIKKIEDDAKAQARQIKAEAEQKIDETRNAFKEREKEVKKRRADLLEAEKTQKMRGAETVARMNERSMVLSAKRSLLDEAFRKALKQLSENSENDARQVIETLLKRYKNDLPNNGKTVAAKGQSEALASAFRNAGLSFEAAEDGAFHGGFRVRGDSIELDASTDTLLAGIRPELEPEISKLLFS